MDGAARRRHLVDGLSATPQEKPGEYIVYEEDNQARAVNGKTDGITFTNANPSTLLTNVLTDIKSGGVILVKPAFYGTVSGQVTSADVSFGHHVKIELGATDIRLNRLSGSTHIVEDYQRGEFIHQLSGTVWYQVHKTSGTILPGAITLGPTVTAGLVTANSGVLTNTVTQRLSGQGVTIGNIKAVSGVVASIAKISGQADFYGTAKVNTVLEQTAGNGVSIEGVVIKDSGLIIGGDTSLDRTGTGVLSLGSGDTLTVYKIEEKQSGDGILVESVLLKNSGIVLGGDVTLDRTATNTLTLGSGDTFLVDTVNEQTTNNGVIVEGVILKDSDVLADVVTASGNSQVNAQLTVTSGILANRIAETQSGENVTAASPVVLQSGGTTNAPITFTIASGSAILVATNENSTTPGGGLSGTFAFTSGVTGFLPVQIGAATAYIPYWIA